VDETSQRREGRAERERARGRGGGGGGVVMEAGDAAHAQQEGAEHSVFPTLPVVQMLISTLHVDFYTVNALGPVLWEFVLTLVNLWQVLPAVRSADLEGNGFGSSCGEGGCGYAGQAAPADNVDNAAAGISSAGAEAGSAVAAETAEEAEEVAQSRGLGDDRLGAESAGDAGGAQPTSGSAHNAWVGLEGDASDDGAEEGSASRDAEDGSASRESASTATAATKTPPQGFASVEAAKAAGYYAMRQRGAGGRGGGGRGRRRVVETQRVDTQRQDGGGRASRSSLAALGQLGQLADLSKIRSDDRLAYDRGQDTIGARGVVAGEKPPTFNLLSLMSGYSLGGGAQSKASSADLSIARTQYLQNELQRVREHQSRLHAPDALPGDGNWHSHTYDHFQKHQNSLQDEYDAAAGA